MERRLPDRYAFFNASRGRVSFAILRKGIFAQGEDTYRAGEGGSSMVLKKKVLPVTAYGNQGIRLIGTLGKGSWVIKTEVHTKALSVTSHA